MVLEGILAQVPLSAARLRSPSSQSRHLRILRQLFSVLQMVLETDLELHSLILDHPCGQVLQVNQVNQVDTTVSPGLGDMQQATVVGLLGIR